MLSKFTSFIKQDKFDILMLIIDIVLLLTMYTELHSLNDAALEAINTNNFETVDTIKSITLHLMDDEQELHKVLLNIPNLKYSISDVSIRDSSGHYYENGTFYSWVVKDNKKLTISLKESDVDIYDRGVIETNKDFYFIFRVMILMVLSFVNYRRIKSIINQKTQLEVKNSKLQTITFSLFHDTRGPLDDTIFAKDLIKDLLTTEQIVELGLSDVVTLLEQGTTKQRNILDGLKYWLENSNIKTKEAVNIEVLVNELVEMSNFNGIVEVNELPTLTISKHAFMLVFDNLIKNGLKYNHSSNPKVTIYSEKNRIVIEDNGDGFEMATFNKLVQPFHRGSQTDSSGSGLGLAICKAIVEEHGYKFNAESTVGKGSRFFIEYE